MSQSPAEGGPCQCIEAPEAGGMCLVCGCMRESLEDRLERLRGSVIRICRDKLAKTLKSIRSPEDFQRVSENEQQQIIAVIRVLHEIQRLSLQDFQRFALDSKWARRLIKVSKSTAHPVHRTREVFSFHETNFTRAEHRRVELHNLLTTKLSARLMLSCADDEEVMNYLAEITQIERETMTPPPQTPPAMSASAAEDDAKDAADDVDDVKIHGEEDDEDEDEDVECSTSSESEPDSCEDEDVPPPQHRCCIGGKCFRHRTDGHRNSLTLGEVDVQGHFKIYAAATGAPRIELWESHEDRHVHSDNKRADIAASVQHLRDAEEVLHARRVENEAEAARLRQVVDGGEAEMQRAKRRWHAEIARLIEEKSESDKARLDSERALEQKESEIKALRARYQDMEVNLRERDADRLDFGIHALEQKESEMEALRIGHQDAEREVQRMEMNLREKDAEMARLYRLMDKMQSQLRRSEAENERLRTEYKEPVDEILTNQLAKMNEMNKINEEMERKCSAMEQAHRAEREQMAHDKCELATKTAEAMERQRAENKSLRAKIAKMTRRRKR